MAKPPYTWLNNLAKPTIPQSNYPEEKGQVRIRLTLTHEEIAQMIGSSRETVTRLLADFRKKQLLQVMGSTLVIKNKSALESIVNG